MIQFDPKNCFNIGSKKDQDKPSSEFYKILKEYQHLKKYKKNEPGFQQLPYQNPRIIQNIIRDANEIRKKFDHVLIIGIGGSALGALALIKSLKPFYGIENQKPYLHFLDNPESDYARVLLQKLDPRKTFIIVISKSGETIESLALFSVFYKYLKSKLGNKTAQHIMTITEEKDQNGESTLWRIHKKIGCKNYAIEKEIGGRFSVLSVVGLLPAAIAGIDIMKILKGAQKVSAEKTLQLAILQYIFYLQKKYITVFFPYGKKFDGIADWYIQLLAESIGKNKKIGPTPLKAIGALDQHAQLQLFMDGPSNKFFIFLTTKKEKNIKIPAIFQEESRLKSLKGCDLHQLLLIEAKATIEALTEKERPNLMLQLSQIDEQNVGELLFLLELQVAFLGELFHINAFDQPGVELGKKLMQHYLQK